MKNEATLFPELFTIDQYGVSPQQVAEITVTYSRKIKPSDMPKISSSNDAFQILRRYWKDDIDYIERFYILLLNNANRVMGICNISHGGITGTVADARVIFAIALKTGATSLILAHNHPSGNLKPSEADINITSKLKNAGNCLEIPVLDHVIIGDEKYYSFADDGSL